MRAVATLSVILTLTGCFPSVHEIQASCAQTFNPETKRELYMHCVDTQTNDVQRRREAVAEGFRRMGESNRTRKVNCTTRCSYGTCYTTCD